MQLRSRKYNWKIRSRTAETKEPQLTGLYKKKQVDVAGSIVWLSRWKQPSQHTTNCSRVLSYFILAFFSERSYRRKSILPDALIVNGHEIASPISPSTHLTFFVRAGVFSIIGQFGSTSASRFNKRLIWDERVGEILSIATGFLESYKQQLVCHLHPDLALLTAAIGCVLDFNPAWTDDGTSYAKSAAKG